MWKEYLLFVLQTSTTPPLVGTSEDPVLVLENTNALVTNVQGEVRNLDWSSNGAFAYGSCSVNFKNEMFIFGQVSSN